MEELLALLFLGLFQPGPARQDHVVAVLVQFDDFRVDRGADVRLQVTHPAQLNQGGGQEAPEADVHYEAALDDLDDRAGDHPVTLLDLLDPAPGPLVLGPLLGQDQTALLVLPLEDHCFDLLADGDDLAGVHAVPDGELPRRDHALRLVADVQQDLVLVDPDNRPLDQLAVLDVDHGGRIRLVQGQVSEVVLGDGAGGVGTALVEGPHGRGVGGWCSQGQVGHGFFSSDGSRWIRKRRNSSGRDSDRVSLPATPGNPFCRLQTPETACRRPKTRNSGCSRSGNRGP